MSSRSNGVTNVELIAWYRSWVIPSLSCSTSASRPLSDRTSVSARVSWASSSVPRTRFLAARLNDSKSGSVVGRNFRRTVDLSYGT